MFSTPHARRLPLALLLAALVAALLAPAAFALGESSDGIFSDREKPRVGGVIGVAGVAVEDLAADDPLRRDWESFFSAQDGRWRTWIDRRSGLPALAQGRGIDWTPADGSDPDVDGLAEAAREFLRAHRVLLGDWGGQLVLDRDASGRRGDHVWHLAFRQEVDGVPVEGSAYEFQLSHGRLVAFGTRRWGEVRTATTPALSAVEARARLDEYVGLDGTIPTTDVAAPELVLVPVDPARADGDLWTGARGAGYDHRLIWRFRFVDPEGVATWTGEVDAVGGEIVAFYDDTRYDRVMGHVNPISDDGDCPTGGCLEADYPMPFVDWTEDGGAVQYTGDFGLLECSLGSTVGTTLNGTYFRIADQCGAISESTTCDDPLDLGVSGGLNCAVAPGESAGNTDAARSAYYSLNRVNQKARFWLPGNAWLDGQVTCRSNVNSTCNASWNGQINMYRAGNGCGNTSQIQGVVTHEWGHGFDQNDGGGYDSSSESYADVVAIFESRTSCVGRGFYADGRTCSGYGDTCLSCTGIRDHDWSARTRNTPATPTNFTADCGSGSGPCGRQVHCESYVSSETMFDLATRDLPAAGLDADTAWQLAERLWYQSRAGSGGPIYNCSLPSSDSCGTGTWYHQLRLQDDDDGDLSNGTPHGAAIFAAFDRHDIACGGANDPENQSTAACPSLATPVISTRALTNAVEISWDPVPDAAAYRIYRNEIGCDRAQVPLAEVAAPATTYLDDDLPNDFTVWYRVQAIGSNASCESAVSTCTEAAAQALAGRVKFGRATYGCSNTIDLRVIDANHSSGVVTIEVWSDTEPTPELIDLIETAPGSGKYDGSIASTSGAAVSGDGLLSLGNGDVVTARYVDEDDGAGNTDVEQIATAAGDCVFPVITGVDETGVTGSAATIVWTTNEISDTVVRWGETTPPQTVATGANRVTAHSVGLSGLAECTVYWYQVESTDPAGNLALDDNGGQYYRFETLGDFGSGLQPCQAGQVAVGTATVSCSDSVSFQVTDLGLNTDPTVVDTAVLLVTSTTETAAEAVTVTETGPNTSVFAGTIGTASGAPQADGLVQVEDGDLITITYQDADDGAGFPAVSFDTAVADCDPAGISNLRVTSITQARATFEWTSDEATDTVVEWGFTPALGNVDSASTLVTNHTVTITDFDLCGDVYFRIVSTDRYGNTTVHDAGGEPFRFRTYDIPGLYVLEDFEDGAADWTLQGEWEVSTPAGLGGSSGIADPNGAYNNTLSLGNDLDGLGAYPGDYEPLANEKATSPTWNASTWTDTKLILHRRLNVGSGDQASMVLYFGVQGLPFYRNDGDPVTEVAWTTQELDISAYADGKPAYRMEFSLTSDSAGNHSGWNVDDIILKDGSQPDYAPCGDCDTAPTFAGVASAVDNDACGADGVTVSWQRAPAWGTGGGGTYSIYRDTAPGFTPSVSNRIATGLTTLSYNDLTAPDDGTAYYLVRAENDETCGTGPNNGGLEDGNAVYVGVSTSSTQSVPDVVDGVQVDNVADTHVRLSWPAVASATSYRIYRSTSPDRSTLGLLGEVENTVFDDVGELTNANSYYYEVRAVNACNQEGP